MVNSHGSSSPASRACRFHSTLITCINASAIWTPRHGRAIAEAMAHKLASVKPLPADDPEASIAAFANPAVAESISATIDHGLRDEDATDLTQEFRGTPRHVRQGRIAYLLPTIVHCARRDHALANREFLFPYGSANFASKLGQLAGNHFATVIKGQERLPEMGRMVLWLGAQDLVIREIKLPEEE